MEILFIAAPITALVFAFKFHDEGRGWLWGFLYGLFLSPIALVHLAIIVFKESRSTVDSFMAKFTRPDSPRETEADHGLQPPFSIEDCTRAIELQPNEPYLYQARGEVYRELSRYEDAVADFTMAIRLEPRDAQLYHARGTAWFGLHRQDEAIDDFTAAIELIPAHAGYFLSRGLSYKNQDMYDRAVEDFNEAVKLDPNDESLYRYLGECWVELSEYDIAIENFSNALDIEPKAETLAARGDLFLRKREFANALDDYEQALRLSPSADAYSLRGAALKELGEYDLALADFRAALRLDPFRPHTHAEVGLIYMQRGDTETTIVKLTEAIETLPALLEDVREQLQNSEQELDAYNFTVSYIAELYNLRALCHFMRGDTRLAISDYSSAMKLNPDEAKYHHGRGGCHVMIDDNDQAVEDLSKAIMLSSHGESSRFIGNSHSIRGIAYLNLNDYKNALSDFDAAIRLEVSLRGSYTGRAACRLHFGQYQSALCDLDTAITRTEDPSTLENESGYMIFHMDSWYSYALRGLAHSMLGSDASAGSDIETAVELGFDHSSMKELFKELVPAWDDRVLN